MDRVIVTVLDVKNIFPYSIKRSQQCKLGWMSRKFLRLHSYASSFLPVFETHNPPVVHLQTNIQRIEIHQGLIVGN